MKNNGLDILLTKIFLTIATATGATLKLLQDADLILGLLLKIVSIISFTIVIALNLPKLKKMIRIFFKSLK